LTGRRELTFASLDDVMPEVERLLDGHETVGRWSLGQILHHLTQTLRLTVEAVPDPAAPPVPEVIRRRFFRMGRFPDGVECSPILVPGPNLDAPAEAEALREALARFAASNGPFPTHPRLGTLTKDEWDLLHRIHCAHHLGFARPQEQAS
jgi:hypothetical protein